MSYRFWVAIAGLLGALAVIAGAVGAHTLAAPPGAKVLFDIAQRYHMIHALALLGVAWLVSLDRFRQKGRGWLAPLAGLAFLGGVILFSGLLYLRALTGFVPRVPLVPVGGTLLIVGWGLVTLSAVSLPPSGRKQNVREASAAKD